MGVINRKERFATEGVRFQRHNPDGTIPTPQRFLGFANTADLSGVLTNGIGSLTIKIDSEQPMIKDVDFSGAANPGRVTVAEAITALNEAGFQDIVFSVDPITNRLKGSYLSGTKAVLNVSLSSAADITLPEGIYSLFFNGNSFVFENTNPKNFVEDVPQTVAFTAISAGNKPLPNNGQTADISTISPNLPGILSNWEGTFTSSTAGAGPLIAGKIIQVLGKTAAALGFGQGIRHGGNGLEVISFFGDETISIGLPKDIKDKEEIDIEGAKGTITRMVIGAMLQGLSPVVTLRQKDYFLLELIQGGRLDRINGTYDPPLSRESDPPTFWAEIYSAAYSAGTNKASNIAAYEKILLRSMIGMEGDVPIEAKAWATYAFNLTATEYNDEFRQTFPAWQEQSLSLEQFDALKVKQVSMPIAA
jgi:hypothetical protein